MISHTTYEILQEIAQSCQPSTIDTSSDNYRVDGKSSLKLSRALLDQLGVTVTPTEVESSGSLSVLSDLVESRLYKNRSGKTLIDIYLELQKLAKEEYHPKIPYQWFARWNDFIKVGNWLSRPEGLDAVDVVIRMEDTYEITISDADAAALETIGQTVRYLWRKDSRESTAR